MKIETFYGKCADDGMLEQLMYMECEAMAFYESLNTGKGERVICAIPTETLRQFARRTASTLFLVKTAKVRSKTRIVGMACLSRRGKRSRMNLHTLYVSPTHRRAGIGWALVSKALSIAKKHGVGIVLGVNPLNAPAIALYAKMGFRPEPYQIMSMEWRPRKAKGGEKDE